MDVAPVRRARFVALAGDNPTKRLTLRDLFGVFLTAGLTFGGGLSIVAVLERDLVRDRQAISRDEFLTLYAMARVVPTGTQTALAVLLGKHVAGVAGSVAAAAGLLTPVFVTSILLAFTFTRLEAGTALDILPVTVLPAALALIAVGAIGLTRDVIGCNRETGLALAAFLAAAVVGMSPGIVLVLGGLMGLLLFRGAGGEKG